MKTEAIVFHGQEIPCVQNEAGEVFVAVKTICEAIGLDYERAKRNIKEHPVLSGGMSVQTYPTTSGVQEMVCLNLDYLHGWLFSISVNHVRKEIRPKLLTYQRECYKVLKDHFSGNKKSEGVNYEMQVAAFQALQARRVELYEAMRTAQREIYHVEKRLHDFDFDHPEQTQLKIDFTVSVTLPVPIHS
jgi:hypothetical protein